MAMDRDSATKCLAALILAVAAPACANGDSAGTMGDDSSGSVVAASGSVSPSSGSVSPSSGSSSSSGSLFATSGSLAPNSGTTASSGGSGSNASTSSGGFGSAGNSAGESSDAAIGSEATQDASGGAVAAEGGNGGPPPSTGLSVLYEVGASATTSAYLGCEISITNGGTSSPAVSSLKARYYFTDEVHLTEQMTINWSHISTSGADADSTVTAAFAPLVPAATDADTYIEFSFSSRRGVRVLVAIAGARSRERRLHAEQRLLVRRLQDLVDELVSHRAASKRQRRLGPATLVVRRSRSALSSRRRGHDRRPSRRLRGSPSMRRA
jgi:hypothetical protein